MYAFAPEPVGQLFDGYLAEDLERKQRQLGECCVVAWHKGMLVETDLQVRNLRSDLVVSAVVDLKRLNSKMDDG